MSSNHDCERNESLETHTAWSQTHWRRLTLLQECPTIRHHWCPWISPSGRNSPYRPVRPRSRDLGVDCSSGVTQDYTKLSALPEFESKLYTSSCPAVFPGGMNPLVCKTPSKPPSWGTEIKALQRCAKLFPFIITFLMHSPSRPVLPTSVKSIFRNKMSAICASVSGIFFNTKCRWSSFLVVTCTKCDASGVFEFTPALARSCTDKSWYFAILLFAKFWVVTSFFKSCLTFSITLQ